MDFKLLRFPLCSLLLTCCFCTVEDCTSDIAGHLSFTSSASKLGQRCLVQSVGCWGGTGTYNAAAALETDKSTPLGSGIHWCEGMS